VKVDPLNRHVIQCEVALHATMKTPIALIVCVAAVATVAGEFVNLTFDQPDFSRLAIDPPTGSLSAPIGDMLPGWEVSLNRTGQWQPYTGLIELSRSIGGSPVALSKGVAYGNSGFGVSMQAIPAIGFPPGPRPPDVRISTKGTVPANAIFFEWYEGTAFDLTISDGLRTLTAVGNSSPMNIAQFSGKEVTISFFLRSGGFGGVDVIGFAQTAREIPISQPSKLRLSLSGKDTVTLTWAPPTDGVQGYAVFSAPNLETPFTNRVGGLVTEISFTFPRPDADSQFYQVRSVGASSRSGEVVTKSSVDVTPEVP
jgi:hypothetical protein